MSDTHREAGPAPETLALKTLALKTLAFLAALAASVLAGRAVYGLLGLAPGTGPVRLDSAGWITALLMLMTVRPRGARHWGLVAGSLVAVVVAAALGAALGELLVQRGLVAGGAADPAVRIGALLALWGPTLLVCARLLYRSGFVVEAWQAERQEDARPEP